MNIKMRQRVPAPPKRTAGRQCSVCANAQRPVIDVALARGADAAAVAQTYALGRMSVIRHRKNCLPAKLAVAGAQRAEQLNAQWILDEFVDLHERTKALLDHAEREGDIGDIARVIREQRENLVATGKLVGAFPRETASTTIDNRTQTIVNVSALRDLSPDELRDLIRVLPRNAA